MTSQTFVCGTLVALLASVGIGCGAGASQTEASFCEQKALKECGTTGSAGVADRCLVPAASCKDVRQNLCIAWSKAIKMQYPTTRPFNPGQIGPCLDTTASVYKKSIITPTDTDAVEKACERVFSGTAKKSQTCANDFECEAPLICDPVQLVCAPSVALKLGDFCGAVPGELCGPGLYCGLAPGTASKTCVVGKAMDEICDAANPCVENLRCNATTGTCAMRVDIGVACQVNADCMPTAPYCDSYLGNVCDTGFIPAPKTPECAAFGATATAGGGGANGSAGGASGSAGGASGGVGGSSGGLVRAGGAR